MKFTISKPVEVNIAKVRIVAPVKYDDEDIPYDFPFRKGDVWDVTVDVDTKTIIGWPQGRSAGIHMKVTDGGSYYLLGDNDEVLASLEQEYVPHGACPGEYGDYITMCISESGKITNWTKPFHPHDFSEFPDLRW